MFVIVSLSLHPEVGVIYMVKIIWRGFTAIAMTLWMLLRSGQVASRSLAHPERQWGATKCNTQGHKTQISGMMLRMYHKYHKTDQKHCGATTEIALQSEIWNAFWVSPAHLSVYKFMAPQEDFRCFCQNGLQNLAFLAVVISGWSTGQVGKHWKSMKKLPDHIFHACT